MFSAGKLQFVNGYKRLGRQATSGFEQAFIVSFRTTKKVSLPRVPAMQDLLKEREKINTVPGEIMCY